jgi:hypothetical protein
MMRKLFGGTMAFSLVGSVLLGGVLAWQASDSVEGVNQVGAVGLSVSIDGDGPIDISGPDGVLLGPNGYKTKVALLDLQNTGDFNLKFRADGVLGNVQILSVSPIGLPDETTCASSNFEGVGTGLTNANALLYGDPSFVLAPAPQTGNFADDAIAVWIAVKSDAPVSCENDLVSWQATVVMTAVGGGSSEFVGS